MTLEVCAPAQGGQGSIPAVLLLQPARSRWAGLHMALVSSFDSCRSVGSTNAIPLMRARSAQSPRRKAQLGDSASTSGCPALGQHPPQGKQAQSCICPGILRGSHEAQSEIRAHPHHKWNSLDATALWSFVSICFYDLGKRDALITGMCSGIYMRDECRPARVFAWLLIFSPSE